MTAVWLRAPLWVAAIGAAHQCVAGWAISGNEERKKMKWAWFSSKESSEEKAAGQRVALVKWFTLDRKLMLGSEGSSADPCCCWAMPSNPEQDMWLLTSEDEYVQYQSILSYFSTSPPNRTGFAPFSWCLSYSTQRYCREKKATSAGCVQASPKLFGLISCKMLGLVQVLQNSCALHSSPKPNGFNKLTVLI